MERSNIFFDYIERFDQIYWAVSTKKSNKTQLIFHETLHNLNETREISSGQRMN